MAKSLIFKVCAAIYARYSADRHAKPVAQAPASMEHMDNPFKPAPKYRPSPGRVAIYCRHTSKDSRRLERQRSLCTDYVAAHFPGAAIEVFEDAGEPAAGLMTLRSKLFRTEFDAVVVESFDRFTRDFHSLQAILATLMISDVPLYTVEGGPKEIPLVKYVLWGAVARLDGDKRLHSIGREWWDLSGEAEFPAK